MKLDVNNNTETNELDWVCWTQEREWRCPIEYKFSEEDYEYGILVKSVRQAEVINRKFYASDYQGSKPIAVLPLDIVCQGLV